ncbi:DUF3576 domain-containing protein [Sulfitobacter sp. D35]|uniref:DUF3576 domain-containing protein n=1 Tax=Sulfitobacter sp. D35 TaxID=3083252 RepID=UPI00296F9655|nr:DUF3576 domain-containing protein [Sulfitobacter sp. D35]MDW4498337.1 DUF3576 domain-containing protein [Sulfitobacter sp. D35]
MKPNKALRLWLVPASLLALAACGQGGNPPEAGPFPSETTGPERDEARAEGNTIWDLFNRPDHETQVQVNRYLWSASLEVLDFLPVQTVDPFTGVIVTGFGTPPGGGRSYRATVLISDPALDARSLNVSLQTSGGGSADAATVRAVEDAILNRARQLRIRDNRL